MVTVEDAIIAKIDKDGKHFEILVDPELAYDLRDGKSVSIGKMLAANVVCTDVKKGDKASAKDVESVFGTNDLDKITEYIVKHGDVQLTTEFRKKKTGERKKQIAAFISRNAMNPQTRLPHPPERILAAMEQAHAQIDPFKPAEQQVEEVIDSIKEIIPISLEEIVLTIEIPAAYSARSYGAIKEYGIIDEKWLSDGSLFAKVKIPAGLKENVFRRLGGLTHGEAKIEEVKEKHV
ncbi:MAG: ribosome assembly factor SBDS [Candidatus Aenigmarchaeota archaeon]|nr:ribosome assembly factor SBDS [Candidatus Aenigmarchaeota archaeon]